MAGKPGPDSLSVNLHQIRLTLCPATRSGFSQNKHEVYLGGISLADLKSLVLGIVVHPFTLNISYL